MMNAFRALRIASAQLSKSPQHRPTNCPFVMQRLRSGMHGHVERDVVVYSISFQLFAEFG